MEKRPPVSRRTTIKGLLTLPLVATPALLAEAAWAGPGIVRDPSGMSLKTPRFATAAVAHNDAIYVLCGSGPRGLLNDVERINPRTRKIEVLPETDPPLTPRRYHAAVSVGEEIILMGGSIYDPVAKKVDTVGLVERWNVRTGKVRIGKPMPTPRWALATVAYNGRVFAIGGTHGDKRLNTVDIYNVERDEWRPGLPLPLGRDCCAAVYQGVIYVPGGFAGKDPVPDFDAYSIGQARWLKMPEMPLATSAHHTAIVGDTLLSFGDYRELRRVLVFNLKTRQWRKINNSQFEPTRHSAVVSLGDRCYVIGGARESRGSFLDLIQEFVVGTGGL